jgi:protein-L-isoaspartate O-methyltransferase
LKPAPKKEQLPLCNYRAPEGFIMIENRYTRGEMIKYPQVDMTKAEYAKIYTDYKGTRTVENTHRVRIAIKAHEWFTVFITDSKVHVKPEPPEDNPKAITQEPGDPEADLREMWTQQGVSEERQNELIAGATAKAQQGAMVGPFIIPTEDKDARFHAMKETLKEGIKTAVAPQLFPTPAPIAEKMVELADLKAGQSILEPSAGTGNIIMAIRQSMANGKSGRCVITAVEINRHMCDRLINVDALGEDFVHCGDFLEHNGALGPFDRIIMNPPFENAVDIKHINHALTMLNRRGRLVALCANGPRQREAFMDMAEYWEDLPAGSFKEQGTGVSVALMAITKEG